MLTATVETAAKGLPCNCGLLPAASTTIMVSPMARLVASNNAPTITGKAAGNTTWRIVSEWVAPNPKATSRKDFGNCLMMFADNDETKGTIIMPITTPAVKALVARTSIPNQAPTVAKKGPTAVNANTPYTMVGMPANISITGLAKLRNFVG